MNPSTSSRHMRTALFATAFAAALSYSTAALSTAQQVNQINLVTDNATFLASQGFTPANTVDPNSSTRGE